MMEGSPRSIKEGTERCYEEIYFKENANGTAYLQEAIFFKEQPKPIGGGALNKILHKSVGALTFLNKQNILGVGSGVLISRDVVLTAAHNIFDRSTKSENRGFKFYLGADGEAEEYHQFDQWRYPEDFKFCPPTSKLFYNFAIMKLKRPVHFEKYMDLNRACENCLLKRNRITKLKVYGFPCTYPPGHSKFGRTFKKNFKRLDPNDQQSKNIKLIQYGLACEGRIALVKAEQSKIGYRISTFPGQSGCPVVVDDSHDNNDDDDDYIIAVHVGGDQSKLNVGRIVDASFINSLLKWRKELNAAPFNLRDYNICQHVKQTQEKMGYMIDFSYNELKLVSLRKYGNLLELDLHENKLRQIDLVHCPHLITINLGYNQLQRIDLSNNKQLTALYLQQNQLQKMNVMVNANLSLLDLSYNQLQELDVSANVHLTTLSVDNNKLQEIDVSANVHLTTLSLSNNKLQEIDVSANVHLTTLSVDNNKLQEIDVSANVHLTTLSLSNNKLQEIDVSANTNLIRLCLPDNKLYELEVSSNVNLIRLDLRNNRLQELDLRANINLVQLILTNNRIKEIDLTENSKLKRLCLQENELVRMHLLIVEEVEEEMYNSYNFNISDQQSVVCRVQLICEEQNQAVREKAIKLVNKWMQKYSDRKYNYYYCAYSFLAY